MSNLERCFNYKCNRPPVEPLGRLMTCGKCTPSGHDWSRLRLCSECGGELQHADGHWHNRVVNGVPVATCCECGTGEVCEATAPLSTPEADARLRQQLREYRRTAGETAVAVAPPPKEKGERGAFVLTEKTGKTAHSANSEGLAVCGTRSVANGNRTYYDALPPGYGHCWKCVRDA